MSAILALALSLGLAAAPPPSACPGPRLSELEAQSAPFQVFHFRGRMLPAFAPLWPRPDAAPEAEPAFDRVTVVLGPGPAYGLLFGLGDCTVGLARTSPAKLFRAMRAAVGPAV